MRRMFLFYLVLNIGASVPAFAADAKWGDLINGENVQWASKAYRIALAKNISDFLKPIYLSVPSPSPEEKQWLKSERRRIQEITDRKVADSQLLKLFYSYPAEIERAKTGFENIFSSINCIITSSHSETSCWSELATELLEIETFEAVKRLKNQKKLEVPKDGMWSDELGWSYWPQVIGKGIIEYLITPHLRQYESRDQ